MATMMRLLKARRNLVFVAVCLIIISTLHLLTQVQEPSVVSNIDPIDPVNLNFLIDHKTCTTAAGSEPMIVIFVSSAPCNFVRRQAIRDTWGRKDNRSLLIFLFGAVENTILNDALLQENELHNDFVQGNFVDSYRNLTYKHVMGFKWFKDTCKHTNFLLKTDDDVLVNSPLLYESLEMFYSTNQTIVDIQKQSSLKLKANQLIFGQKAPDRNVHRKNNKWTVSYKEYSKARYPPYCSGFAIMYSADVVKKLYEQALTTRYFWIEDVFPTGILRKKLNIPLTDGRDFYLTSSQTDDILANTTDEAKKLKHKFIFSKYDLSDGQIRKLWSVLIN